jgi:hypothetical protein
LARIEGNELGLSVFDSRYAYDDCGVSA